MIKKSKKRLILQQLEERVLLDANPLLVIDSTGESGVAEPLDVPLTSAAEAIVSESLNITSGQEEKVIEEQSNATPIQQSDAQQTAPGEDINENENIPVDDTPAEDLTLPTAQTDKSTEEVATTKQLAPLEVPTEKTTELVVVDSKIYESESFVDEIQKLQTDPEKDITIVEINSDTSGVDQISELFEESSEVDALHIFSHGVDGRIYLGSDVLYSANFNSYSDALKDWDLSLNDGADILLYGCSIAETDAGQDVVKLLASTTGADVAASTDATGDPSQGADWDLEYSVGDITTETFIPAAGLAGWDGVLDPTPTVTIDMPTDGLIEEEINFTVTFDNTGPTGDIGYAPYMEVYIPVSLNITGVSDNTAAIYSWDGTAWVGATTVIPGTDNHPLDNSAPAILTVPSGQYIGDSWYIFELPFGSYTPEQPSFSVDFTAELDEDAVMEGDSSAYGAGDALVDTPIQVIARGGFQYGIDPKDNPNADPAIEGDAATGEVTPRLLTINKTSDAPEGQSATGPNYPVTYTIEVDIAPDQTIEDLVITDLLPDNAVYRDDYVLTGATIQSGSLTPTAWSAGANNEFVLNLGDVTGNSADDVAEITLTYSAYYDATALGSCGDSDTAFNLSGGTGEYDHPVDGDDQTYTAVDPDSGNIGSSVQHQINSITAEKSVTITTDNGSAGLTPGDVLTYKVYFEISDYFGFENIVVTDLLGDGQYITGTNHTLTVVQNGATTNLNWDSSTVDINRSTTTGISTVQFDVSGLLEANGFTDGELYGDLFNSPGTGATDNTVNRPGGGTYGWIEFEAIVDDHYIASSTVDTSVDANDPILNNVTISGDVLSTTATANGYDPQVNTLTGEVCTQGDNSETELVVIGIDQDKTIVPPDVSNFAPGDVVTYRLFTSLPIGSVEDFIITDYLPLPIFDVGEFDPDGDGNIDFSNSITVGESILESSIDLSVGGQVYWGTGTTIQNAPGIGDSANDWPPVLSKNDSSNSLLIDLGTFNSIGSEVGPWGIEILITATVQNVPFADDLNLTNQATWYYDNTFDVGIATGDIVQIKMVAPEVTITKGVIATDSPDGVYDTDPPEELAGLQVNNPSSSNTNALLFTDNVTAADFLANPMDSNLEDVDGGDLVTFAISLANAGGSGAYGLQVKDTKPDGFILPDSGYNLQVWDGLGNLLTEDVGAGGDYIIGDSSNSSNTSDTFFDADGITFTDGVLDGDRLGERPDTTSGDDLIIITYTLEADNTLDSATMVQAGSTLTNTASITYFTGSISDIGDADKNWIDPTDPPQDDAQVNFTEPTIAKALVGTEIVDAGSGNGINELDEAVIGERVEYSVAITVPEGMTLNMVLTDQFDRGLELVSIDSIKILDDNGNIHSSTGTDPIIDSSIWNDDFTKYDFTNEDLTSEDFTNFQTLIDTNLTYTYNDDGNSSFTLDLGNIQNLDTDNDTDEVIVISYTAMVVNDSANLREDDVQLSNAATLSYNIPIETDTGTIFAPITSATVQADAVTVIEPALKVVKTSTLDPDGSPVNSGPANLLDNETAPDWVDVDAGDLIEYSIVISHDDQFTDDRGATAYDVTFYDNLPTSYFDNSPVTLDSAILSGPNPDADLRSSFALSDIDGDGELELYTTSAFDLEYNETLTIMVSGKLNNLILATAEIINTAEIDWTSYNETPDGSGFVSDGDDTERGGDDADAGEVNDYSDSDPTQLKITVSGEKYIVNSEYSDEDNASAEGELLAPLDTDGINNGREAVIGELITYELVYQLPEAELLDAVIIDTLPAGLTLVSIDAIKLDDPFGTVSFGNQALLNYDWDTNNYTNDASGSIDISPFISYSAGNELSIEFGRIINLVGDEDYDEILTITYTVMVNDTVDNTGNDIGNQGARLENSAQAEYGLGANAVQGVVLHAEEVEILEPDLAMQKTVVVEGPGDAGDEITYTLSVTHTGGSEANAYDLNISDNFIADIDPSTLLVDAAQINGVDLSPTIFAINIATGELTTARPYDLDLLIGQTLVVTIKGNLADAVNPGDEITNSADLTWTSIDNDDTTVERTDYSNFINTGEDRERTYNTTATADEIVVPTPTVEKELVGTDLTDDANSGLNEATIGEIITYRVSVNLTEGITNGAEIVDTLGTGLSFVDISSVTLAPGSDISSSLGTLTTADPADPTNITTRVEGQNLIIGLGDLTVAGDNTGTDFDSTVATQGNDTLIIEYSAVVTDITTNDAIANSKTFTNSAIFSFSDNGGQTTLPATADPVILVEPDLVVIKTVGTPGNMIADNDPLTGVDAGDTVWYEIQIQHTLASGSGAYDVSLTHDLPDEITFALGSSAIILVSDSERILLSDHFTITESGGIQTLQFATTADPIDFQIDRTVTVRLAGTLLATVNAGEEITNTARVDWTSLPDNHDNNNSTNERGEATDDLDVYSNEEGAIITIASPSFDKRLMDESNTDFTIGETVSYDLIVTVPDGTTNSVIVTDAVPVGMSYISSSLETTAASSDYLGKDFVGTVASFSATTTGLDGAFITFNLGNVIADPVANDDNQFVIRVELLVLDVVDNVGLKTYQKSLENTAEMQFTAGATTAVLGDDLTTSTKVTIIEPELQIIKQVGTPGNILADGVALTGVDAGDTVVYQFTVSHTDQSLADAYDVHVADPLPAEFSASTVKATIGTTDVSGEFHIVGDALVTSGTIDLAYGEILVVTVTGELTDTDTNPGEDILNTSNVDWSTLSGDQNDLSGTTFSDGIDSERDGSGDQATDTYVDDDDALITIDDPTIDKHLVGAETQFTIGEEVTFAVDVTLTEGTTENLVVTDDLPQGLTGISGLVSASTSFNGTWSTPDINYTGGDGNDIVFTFNNIETVGDGIDTNNTLTLLVTARVDNIITNYDQQTLVNESFMTYTTYGADGTPITNMEGTPTAEITIVEPGITTTKEITDTNDVGPTTSDDGAINTADEFGDVFLAHTTHTNSGTSEAYDIVITDQLAIGTEFSGTDIVSITGPARWGVLEIDEDYTLTINSADPADRSFTLTINSTFDLRPGETLTVDYHFAVKEAWTVGGTHYNLIDANWSSMPGTGLNERVYDDTTAQNPGQSMDEDVLPVEDENDKAIDYFTVPEPSSTLGDFVFYDINNNGQMDLLGSADPDIGIAGVQVELRTVAGNLYIATATTDQNGWYGFNNLAGADYEISIVESTLPTGAIQVYEQGTDFDGSFDNTLQVTLATDTDYLDADFGYTGNGSIGDYVWYDRDGDTNQNEVSYGINGATVRLEADLNSDGVVDYTVEQQTTTNAGSPGSYLFDNLMLGSYTVTVVDLPGDIANYSQTADPNGTLDNTGQVVLADWGYSPGDPSSTIYEISNQDFGYRMEGAIGDTVWEDQNGNRIQDVAEPGIAGVTVELSGVDINNDGIEDLLTITTAGDGRYNFTGLPGGEYTITVDPTTLRGDVPFGWVESYDYEWQTQTGLDDTTTYTLAANETFTDADFGYSQTGRIGDRIWYDINNDGVQDGNEPGLVGVSVTLTGDFDLDGTTDTAVTTTVADGIYHFENLPNGLAVGDYTVSVDQTTLLSGLTPTWDFDDIATPHAVSLTLMYDRLDEDRADFGYIGTGTIGDYVWYDMDQDGAQDAIEPGINGVTVTLLADLDNDSTTGTNGYEYAFAPTTTSSASDGTDGWYEFTGLPFVDYLVTVDNTTLPYGLTVPTYDLDGIGTTSANEAAVTLTSSMSERDNVDFGYVGSGQIGDFIWNDLNADGTPDAGEPGLDNILITLTGTPAGGMVGSFTQTFITSSTASGEYLFSGLPEGTYDIVISEATLPAGYIQSYDPDGKSDRDNKSSTTLTSLVFNDDTMDFGYTEVGSIGDYIWYDINGDGIQNPSQLVEPGLENVTVQLRSNVDFDGDGNIDTFTTTTDSNGLYLFEDLPTGVYTVTVDPTTLPGGGAAMIQTFDPDTDVAADFNNASTYTLTHGEDNRDQDFGYQGSGSLGNTVWFDVDENGLQGNVLIEPGIPNVTVILTADLNNDGTVDYTRTTTTNSSGNYLFDNLPFIDYSVSVDPFTVLESSRVQSYDRDGVLDHTASIEAIDFTTYSGNYIHDVDFGYHGEGQLGNLVWDDLNGNGIHDLGEPGIDGVTVMLLIDVNNDGRTDAINSTVTAATADPEQNYLFENLPSGTFTVLIDPTTLPDEYIQSYDYQWTTTDGLNNRSDITITLAEQSNYEQDFGYTQTGSIGDTIWYDANANSSQDEGEPGLAGVTVTLVGDVDLDSIEDTLTTTTDEDGNYIFDGIPIGDYTITVDAATLPEGMIPTYDLDGIETVGSSFFALAYNEDKTDVDFGYTGTGSIGDRIWLDSNRNGIQDTGEPGISGVQITLEADIDSNGSIDYIISVDTDGNGNYLFENLPSGNYNLYLDPNTVPSDLLQTFDPDGSFDFSTNISLGANEINLFQDFGFAPPEPPVFPSIIPPTPPTGPSVIPPEAGDPALAYQFSESAADRAIILMPEPEEPFLLPALPVSPVYTGQAEPGTTITLTVYDALGGAIGYQTVMADTGGNWLASFPGTTFYDIPVRMEISQTESIYNANTTGSFNFRTYFNPALSSMVFSSLSLDVNSVMAYQAGTIEKALSEVHNSALGLAWNDFSGYEFFSSSINPAQHTR